MTHIMTAEGWRPLFDTKPEWDRRHRAIAAARAHVEATKQLPSEDERQRSDRNHALNHSYAQLRKAQDALIGYQP